MEPEKYKRVIIASHLLEISKLESNVRCGQKKTQKDLLEAVVSWYQTHKASNRFE